MKAQYIENGIILNCEIIEYYDDACCLVKLEKKKENSEEVEIEEFYIERSSLKILD